jgi:hypothetical protein
MTKGVLKWDDRKTFSIQTNNAQENILKRWSGKDRGYLESCGPTAAVNLVEAMGFNVACHSPGGAVIQPEDFLMVWMNTPENIAGLIADGVLGNEVAEFYPVAIPKVFGVPVLMMRKAQTFDWVGRQLQSGLGVMLCRNDPGHYIAAVAFDDIAAEIIYRDPWPGRTGTDGFNLRMGRVEYQDKIKPLALIFG